MNISLDWALIVAYNAALQAGFAMMYAKGYRPKGPDRHKTVIRFLHASLEPSFKPTINRLDRIRKKRHQAVYRLAGTIKFAEDFIIQVANLI